jgi:hypothetical protein
MRKPSLKFGFFLSYILLLSTVLISCTTDEDRKKMANETVNIFVKDLDLKNEEALTGAYPSFNKIGKYWILNNFKINDTKLEGNKVTVYASYKRGNTLECSVMFILEEKDSKYIISETKGLSAYYDSDLFNFLKILGCLSDNSNDIEIHEECSLREDTYESTIEELKNDYESKVEIDNSNLSSNYGYYVSGNLIVTNNSDLVVPSGSYNLSIVFINTSRGEGVDKQSVSSFLPDIPSHSTISIPVSYVPINGGNKFGGVFSITNKEPLKKVLNEMVQNLEWNCDKLDGIINSIN